MKYGIFHLFQHLLFHLILKNVKVLLIYTLKIMQHGRDMLGLVKILLFSYLH